VPLDQPVVFVLDEGTDRTDLVRQSLTIGHEHLLGELDGGMAAWLDAGLPVASTPLVGPTDLDGAVLDVRQDGEWVAGHLPGALHVELGRIHDADVPDGPITVMCGHGERAMTGASILAAGGHDAVSVLAGGPDDWSRATGTALSSA